MRNNVLIIGAGVSGDIIGADIVGKTNYYLVGYLDDDTKKHSTVLNTRPVFGSISLLPKFITEHNIDYVIISMPRAAGSVVYNIVNKLVDCDVQVKIIPGYYHFLDEDTKIRYPISSLDIRDIFKKPRLTLNIKDIVFAIGNKKVLITGAGGSIGKELSILIASLSPREIILLGRGENSIYKAYNELKRYYPNANVKYSIVNITNYPLLSKVFKKYRPDIIFHAAAHKHVNLMETHSKEAFYNNVIGSLNLMALSNDYSSSRFLLISTDKAVSPSNVMGATKRIVELLMLSYARVSSTIFSAVRFGNVLGSRGSVVPLFKKQIELGGPITVTDKNVQRYFMTISEAAQLVIQAAAISKGGEVFVLNMGNKIKIYDLAKLLIKLYRPNLYKDIDIVFTGLKEGEKLSEEMWDKSIEKKRLSIHEDIYTLETPTPSDEFFIAFNYIIDNLYSIEEEELKDKIFLMTKLFVHSDQQKKT